MYGTHPPSYKRDPSNIVLNAAQRIAILCHNDVENNSNESDKYTITSLRADVAMYTATLLILVINTKMKIRRNPVIVIIKKKRSYCFPLLRF